MNWLAVVPEAILLLFADCLRLPQWNHLFVISKYLHRHLAVVVAQQLWSRRRMQMEQLSSFQLGQLLYLGRMLDPTYQLCGNDFILTPTEVLAWGCNYQGRLGVAGGLLNCD
jgi:hypothetical protein